MFTNALYTACMHMLIIQNRHSQAAALRFQVQTSAESASNLACTFEQNLQAHTNVDATLFSCILTCHFPPTSVFTYNR